MERQGAGNRKEKETNLEGLLSVYLFFGSLEISLDKHVYIIISYLN